MVNSFSVDFTPFSSPKLHPNSLPLCANCKEAVVIGDLSSSNVFACRLFGSTDVIWGSVQYKPCLSVRRNESECGSVGKYYRHRYFDDE